ncbi:MAG TPA: hypothetical protein VGK19_14695 [Capsulimonadaceae bacterium]
MDRDISQLLKALDLLDAGSLDPAHKIAQRFEGDPLADTIHAIVHRREGDFSNSIYWWNRVGTSIPDTLWRLYGNPVAFVNLARQSSLSGEYADKVRKIESEEITVLRLVLSEVSE